MLVSSSILWILISAHPSTVGKFNGVNTVVIVGHSNQIACCPSDTKKSRGGFFLKDSN